MNHLIITVLVIILMVTFLEEIMKGEFLFEIRSTNLEVKHLLMSLFLIDVLHEIMFFNGIN